MADRDQKISGADRTGAWRGPNEKLKPTFCSGYYRYGGFYTQEQIREVVGYAAKRQVMIMPEIEVPGHSRAVAAAYPEILCDYIDPGKHELSAEFLVCCQ